MMIDGQGNMSATRVDGRANDELRPIIMQMGYLHTAEGSCLISCGHTQVLCAASVEERVPAWLAGCGQGWVTAEYSMLPRATLTRRDRERGGPSGRTHEIERLIGRALRASVDLSLLGERTIILDCDVLQADGGTRTAAISGGYVALALALQGLIEAGLIPAGCALQPVAAVSVGILEGEPILDLCYDEDSHAEVDMNVVMNAAGEYIEIQGTAERVPFGREKMGDLLTLAEKGIADLIALQADALQKGT